MVTDPVKQKDEYGIGTQSRLYNWKERKNDNLDDLPVFKLKAWYTALPPTNKPLFYLKSVCSRFLYFLDSTVCKSSIS